jgi:hypothetical protein
MLATAPHRTGYSVVRSGLRTVLYRPSVGSCGTHRTVLARGAAAESEVLSGRRDRGNPYTWHGLCWTPRVTVYAASHVVRRAAGGRSAVGRDRGDARCHAQTRGELRCGAYRRRDALASSGRPAARNPFNPLVPNSPRVAFALPTANCIRELAACPLATPWQAPPLQLRALGGGVLQREASARESELHAELARQSETKPAELPRLRSRYCLGVRAARYVCLLTHPGPHAVCIGQRFRTCEPNSDFHRATMRPQRWPTGPCRRVPPVAQRTALRPGFARV